MDSATWQKVNELFLQCLEMEQDQRQLLLAERSVELPEVCQEVAALLEVDNDGETEAFLEPISWNLQALCGSDPRALVGSSIGPYRLVESIGGGGMGHVYRAVRAVADGEQTVALKILQPGTLSDERLRLFRNEARLQLRLSDHPHIASFLDAGIADDGRLYLVMEFVSGRPIDQFCRERQLPLRGRLELMISVAGAVAHAHRQLVIHRDLKPSNILVTDQGQPRLVDFGIAKELGNADATLTRWQPLTPDYASPEQVRGERLTTATDIYSLGVVLYELTAGRRPYQTADLTPGELERVVCEVDPPCPSQLFAAMAKAGRAPYSAPPRSQAMDLDAIIMKALSKDPDERYGMAALLADDLERCLRGLPVIARRRTAMYVARKFVRRNRLAVGAASAVLVLLVGFLGTSIGLLRAELNRVRSEKQFAETQLALRGIGDIAGNLSRIGEVSAGSQGKSEGLTVLMETRALLEGLLRASPDDARITLLMAHNLRHLAVVNTELGQTDTAFQNLREALDLVARLKSDHPENEKVKLLEGSCYSSLALCEEKTQDPKGAIVYLETARGIFEPFLIRDANHTEALFGIAQVYNSLAAIHSATRELAAAIELAQKAESYIDRLVVLTPDDADAQAVRGRIYNTRAIALHYLDRSQEALPVYDKALAVWTELVEQHPNAVRHRESLALVSRNMGILYTELQRWDKAIPLLETSVQARKHLADRFPADFEYQDGVAKTYRALADALTDAERGDEACATYERAEAIHARLVGYLPENAKYSGSFGMTLHNHAMALKRLKRLDDAFLKYEQAVERTRFALGVAPGYVNHRLDLLEQYAGLAEVCLGTQRFDRWAEVLDSWQELAADNGGELAIIAMHWGHGVQVKSDTGEAKFPDAAERALQLLRQSFELGHDLRADLDDPAFDTIRRRPDFGQLVEDVKQRRA